MLFLYERENQPFSSQVQEITSMNIQVFYTSIDYTNAIKAIRHFSKRHTPKMPINMKCCDLIGAVNYIVAAHMCKSPDPFTASAAK